MKNKVPRTVFILLFLLFVTGFIALGPLDGSRPSHLDFGLWAAAIGLLGFILGIYYKDEIYVHRSPGLIIAGVLIALFWPY